MSSKKKNFFGTAPTAIQFLSFAVIAAGLLLLILGSLLAADILEIETFDDPTVQGGVIAIGGFIITISGIGLLQLNKLAWFIFVITAIGMITGIIIFFPEDLVAKVAIILFGFILGDLLAENEFFLRVLSEDEKRALEEAGVDPDEAPSFLKLLANFTIVLGIITAIVGILSLEDFNVIEWPEEYDVTSVAVLLIIIGIVIIVSGFGLKKLMKPMYILYIITVIGLITGLIYLYPDDLLPKVVITIVSVLLGDLIAENEFFFKPEVIITPSRRRRRAKKKKVTFTVEED
ncbi:MAG: hypothetical protein ACFFDT_01820 [Candidatus Hodarchaeota archaeon]